MIQAIKTPFLIRLSGRVFENILWDDVKHVAVNDSMWSLLGQVVYLASHYLNKHPTITRPAMKVGLLEKLVPIRSS